MKVIKSARTAGFTLVEMLAVITIIVILAALVVAGMGFAADKQDREKAKIQIALLSSALEEYKMDHGVYPQFPDTASGEDNSSELFDRLFWGGDEKGTKRPEDDDRKIYVAQLDPTDSSQNWTEASGDTYKIVDPWGNEYRYRSAFDPSGSQNPSTQNPDFDLWSVGKDGRTNTSQPYDPDHLDNKDDVRNF